MRRDAFNELPREMTSSLRLALVALSLLVVLVNSATAQSSVTAADQPHRSGTITGRVISDDGQPIPRARINVIGRASTRSPRGSLDIVTDDEGNFRADGLDPAPYSVYASAPGFVLAPDSTATDPLQLNELRFHRLGEAITITMVKGGVITGKVMNPAGEPVIGITVSAIRVRDESGRLNESASYQRPRITDDRGIYRLYGLAPGTYLVMAGGSGVYSSAYTPFTGKTPVYYPSATRDTASEITVRSSEEVTNIDLRYRGERGHSISGKVTGASASTRQVMSANVYLKQANTGALFGNKYIQPGDQNGFAFYAVPDGEYEVVAIHGGSPDIDMMSTSPRRVTVRGNDVTGIELTLVASASIAGNLIMEKLPADANRQKCESKRESSVEETVLVARPEDETEQSRRSRPPFETPPITTPTEKGEFIIRNLKARRYRVESKLPDETWYVKTITLKTAATAPATDPGRNGLALKSGERAVGMTITLAEGAAGLKGKVAAPAGKKLPDQVRVHLVPAEKEAADHVLRYAEAKAGSDGAFSFSHLAPGKYWIMAKVAVEEKT